MGAAKNARKARRKARRSEDRRPYTLDIEAYRYLTGPGASFSYNPKDLELITVWDPRKRENVEVGHKLHLTVPEAAELRALSRATVTPYEPTPTPLFNGGYRSLLDMLKDKSVFDLTKFPTGSLSMFDTPWVGSYTHRMHDANPRMWKTPQINGDGSIQRDPSRGTVTTTKAIADIDFSALEDRITAFMGKQIDKKAFYAALYGATEERVRDLYYDSISYNDLRDLMRERTRYHAADFNDLYMQKPLPTPLIPDPLDRTYRGQKIGDIVHSHPLNQKSAPNDQDLQEVGSVPAHGSRIVRSDTP
jgi:hypothetical protein